MNMKSPAIPENVEKMLVELHIFCKKVLNNKWMIDTCSEIVDGDRCKSWYLREMKTGENFLVLRCSLINREYYSCYFLRLESMNDMQEVITELLERGESVDVKNYKEFKNELDKRELGFVPLSECPTGLFRCSVNYYDEVLCLKTAYVDNCGRCECYIVESGERFWGIKSGEGLNDLLVEPVDVKVLE